MWLKDLISYLKGLRKKTEEVFITREEDMARIEVLEKCLRSMEEDLPDEHLEKIKKQIQEEIDY